MNLRGYQERMIDFVVHNRRGGLFSGMGTGKTVSVLTALDRAELLEPVFPTLVLAPKRVAATTWPEEAQKWPHLQHLRVAVAVGTARERAAAVAAAINQTTDIVTMNYENIPWLMDRLTGAWPFRTVVCDESTKLKSFRIRQGGSRAQALSKIAHRSQRWINLTGTPSPNGLQDLWGQTWFLDYGKRLGASFSAFEERWFRRDFTGNVMTPMPGAQEQITKQLADLCMSLEAKDLFELPPLIEHTIAVDMPATARSLYGDMEDEFFVELEGGEIVAANAAARTMKLLQLANGAIYTDEAGNWEETHDEKIKALDDIVEEASGMPVLVAYHFKSDLARLRRHFGSRLRELDSKPSTISDWNTGKIPILAAHPESAGHGLNLQYGGNILAFFGHWWALEPFLQIIERIGPTRQAQSGLNRPTFVYYIVTRDTIDEDVMHRRKSKESVQNVLMQRLKRRQQA